MHTLNMGHSFKVPQNSSSPSALMLPVQYPHEIVPLLKLEDYEIEKVGFKRNVSGFAWKYWDVGYTGFRREWVLLATSSQRKHKPHCMN